HDVVDQRVVADVAARDVEPEAMAVQAAAVGEFDLEVEYDPVLKVGHDHPPRNRRPSIVRRRAQRSPRWLIATLPRIIAPAMPMASVSGSSSSIHAQATPNSGTR